MRDVDDPELLAYLEAENAAAERFFDPLRRHDRDHLRRDPVAGAGDRPVDAGRVRSVVVRHLAPPRARATRSTTAGRRPIEPPRRVLLDENVEADGHDYFDLGAFDVSMDHRFAAWSTDTDGDEHYTLRIRDLDTGDDLDDQLDDTVERRRRVVARRPVALLRDARRPGTPVHACGATASARHEPTTCCVFDETDERFYRRHRLHPLRLVDRDPVGKPHEQRDPAALDRPADRRSDRSCSSGGRTSSTASITGAIGSSCSPTTTPSTSG